MDIPHTEPGDLSIKFGSNPIKKNSLWVILFPFCKSQEAILSALKVLVVDINFHAPLLIKKKKNIPVFYWVEVRNIALVAPFFRHNISLAYDRLSEKMREDHSFKTGRDGTLFGYVQDQKNESVSNKSDMSNKSRRGGKRYSNFLHSIDLHHGLVAYSLELALNFYLE